jgi:dUTP pyrophosphatase
MSRPKIQLFVKRLTEEATLPTRGSEEAAGLDLYSAKELTIPPLGKATVPTEISIDIPWGHYGRVAPRSGLAHKHHIGVGAGVIDSE